MSPAPRLSVVIPMYRESARIGATLRDLVPWLESRPWPSEVLLVNDGSQDGTEDAAAPFVTERPSGPLARVRLIRHTRNRGKGAAVRTGLANAAGRWVLMMDADNAATVREVEKLFTAAERDHAALAVGSRNAPGAEVTAVGSRRAAGLIFRAALLALRLAPVRDTQCGFKLYRRDLAALIAASGTEDRFAFDIEHLMLAGRAGMKIAEVGIRWTHRDGGTVSPIRDGLRMLWRAVLMRWRALSHTGPVPAPVAAVEVKPMGPGRPPVLVELKPVPAPAHEAPAARLAGEPR